MSRQVVQALAGIVEVEMRDPRVTGVTFTAAHATDDLRNVRVFFSVLGGDQAAIDAAGEGLRAASGFLRRELAQHLALRSVPTLTFEYDESIRRAERIEKLLGDPHD